MVVIPSNQNYTPEQLQALIDAAIQQYIIDHPAQSGSPQDIINQYIIDNPSAFNDIVYQFLTDHPDIAQGDIAAYFNNNPSIASDIINSYLGDNPVFLQQIVNAYVAAHPDKFPNYVYLFNFAPKQVNLYNGANAISAQGTDTGNISNLNEIRYFNKALPLRVNSAFNGDYRVTVDFSSSNYDGRYSNSYMSAVGDFANIDISNHTTGSIIVIVTSLTVTNEQAPFYLKRGSLEVYNYCPTPITVKAIDGNGNQVGETVTINPGFTNNNQYYDHTFFDTNAVVLLRVDADNTLKDLQRSLYNADTNTQEHQFIDMSYTYDLIYYPDLRATFIVSPKPNP